MSPLTLTLMDAPAQGVDMSPLTPDRLQGRSTAEIGRMRLVSAGRRVRVDAVFDLQAGATDHLRIRKATARLHGVGQGMRHGTISVSGSVGDDLGREMQGGVIRLRGNAGNHVGAAMHDGLIDVSGSVGDRVGAGPAGAATGMRGGTVRIGGHAGRRLGDRMRRGLIVVEGDCDEGCASRMLAGTVVVLGTPGGHLGAGMRRGTVLLCGPFTEPGPLFNDCGRVELGWLRLLFRHGARYSRRLAGFVDGPLSVRRWTGDMGSLGKGEIIAVATD